MHPIHLNVCIKHDQYKKLNKERKYNKMVLANPKCLVT